MFLQSLYKAVSLGILMIHVVESSFHLQNSSGIRNQSETFYLAAYRPSRWPGVVRVDNTSEPAFSPPLQTLVYNESNISELGVSSSVNPREFNLTGNVDHDLSLSLKTPSGKYLALDDETGQLVITGQRLNSYGKFSIDRDVLYYETFNIWTVCWTANSTDFSSIYLSNALTECPRGNSVNVFLNTVGLSLDHAIPPYP